MKTTTFALSLLLSQYAIVDGQLANTAQRRVSPTDRFANPSHKQHRTLRTTRTLEEDGSMSLATSMSMMAVEPEPKDMYETTEESIEAVEPADGVAGGVDPAFSGSSKGGKMTKYSKGYSKTTSKATKLFKEGAAKTALDAKAEKGESAAKAEKESQGKAEKMSIPNRKLDAKAHSLPSKEAGKGKAEKVSKASKEKSSKAKSSKAKGEKMKVKAEKMSMPNRKLDAKAHSLPSKEAGKGKAEKISKSSKAKSSKAASAKGEKMSMPDSRTSKVFKTKSVKGEQTVDAKAEKVGSAKSVKSEKGAADAKAGKESSAKGEAKGAADAKASKEA